MDLKQVKLHLKGSKRRVKHKRRKRPLKDLKLVTNYAFSNDDVLKNTLTIDKL